MNLVIRNLRISPTSKIVELWEKSYSLLFLVISLQLRNSLAPTPSLHYDYADIITVLHLPELQFLFT